MSDAIFAALLAVGFTMIAIGAGQIANGADLIVGGLLLTAWAWLVFGEIGTGDTDEGAT